MNFSKEYIKECNCKEIQKLNPYQVGDWYSIDGKPELHFANNMQFVPADAVILWLPLSYQLDDEIVKICKEKDYKYTIKWDKLFDGDFNVIVESEVIGWFIRESDINPLIAKIKLLKELLNG